MTSRSAPVPLLAGLTVVETGGGIATRYCGRLLGKFGARVVRVGDPGRSDTAATRAFDAWLNEGKIASPDLAAALDGLAGGQAKSLVIAGQTPGEVCATDAELATRSCNAVRVGVTWFGDKGPYAAWRGDDAVIQALSGIAYAFGLPRGPPTLPQGHAPQLIAGVTSFIGALAALMAGPDGPSSVDVDILEAALCLCEVGAIAAAANPDLRSVRHGVNRFSPSYPASIYRTADGWVGVTTLTPAQWGSLCDLIGRPDLATAPRLRTSLERLALADEIDTLLTPKFLGQTTAYWVEAGARLRIPITPAPRPRDLLTLEHWAGRAAFAPLAGTEVFAPTLPYRFTFDGVTHPRPSGGPRGPLTGVRVVDFSMGWAGPLAARYLGDLGADVLKIESRARPDWWRGWEIVEAQNPPLHELAVSFMSVNRNKRGLDLDLATAEGKAAAVAILGRADVVIENQGPGVMDRLGLGLAEQRRLRPGVIAITMPPFGRTGPLAGLRAYGSTVEQASGMPFVNGSADWAPSIQHVAYGDPVAGLYGAAVALAAIYGRSALGGAEIELCQVECLFQICADAIIADQLGGVTRSGSRRAAQAPVCVVACAGEEEWLAVSVDRDTAWGALCTVVGDAALAPEWDLAARLGREGSIEAALAAWAAAASAADAAARLQEAGVAAAPVLPAHRLSRNEHLRQSGHWGRLVRRYVGEHLAAYAPIRFDGARPPLTRPAPTLGEHTAEVLAELSLS